GCRNTVLHVHSGNSVLPRSFMAALELVRPKRVVATLQSPVETIDAVSFRGRTWGYLANRRLDWVISPSEHSRQFHIRCGVRPEKVYTVRNSVDIRRFGSGRADVAKASIGLTNEHSIVLFASRFDPIKRPSDALDVFERLASEFPRAHLVMAGSGSEDASLR